MYLYDGIGTATVPVSYRSVNLGVQDKAGKTGWNAMTTVALLYRGFRPGDRVNNVESRRARWAQDCLPNTAAEQFVTFRVKWDRNPKKYKTSDQTWTKYSLRAWAVPQVQGVESYREATGVERQTSRTCVDISPETALLQYVKEESCEALFWRLLSS